MSKSTVAVLMVSVAELPPWGDDGWRLSGAMQLVLDGPDWLYAQWPVLDGADHHGADEFATLVLRENPSQRAADIAAMAFALLRVPEWHELKPWWRTPADRERLTEALQTIGERYAGEFKLAVVQTARGVGADVLHALRTYGFETVEFAPVSTRPLSK